MAKPNGGNSRKRLYWAMAILACVGSFGLGWLLNKITTVITIPPPLRLTGYQYISPLISCNLGSVKTFSQDQPMINAIQSAISQDESVGDVTNASVYFSDFTTGQSASVNGNEQYYPASLGKVPIMMAYYAMAENTSSILDEENSYPVGAPDLNTQQEIPPTDAITPGQEYTNEQLIEYMIKYSDNDAADVLTALTTPAELQGVQDVYSDLQIPLSAETTASSSDIMTPQQYAILFKTLYNATYLSRDYSEQALKLMTQTTFTQGIVAGVPSSTVVSHKYGLASYTSGGVPYQWELHDCGIVYAPGHPYLLCVMTKGTTSIAAQEQTIADISRAAYQEVEGAQ
ncbi:MAG TPA: serine hydrolase [Candidatus Paceibacterota bacterium]|nr:serine hydrolase [Candidatus Paceibacterota bacterium]